MRGGVPLLSCCLGTLQNTDFKSVRFVAIFMLYSNVVYSDKWQGKNCSCIFCLHYAQSYCVSWALQLWSLKSIQIIMIRSECGFVNIMVRLGYQGSRLHRSNILIKILSSCYEKLSFQTIIKCPYIYYKV